MNIEQKLEQTLKKIRLSKNEKILVALSGGKDSTVTAYLLKKFGYNIEGIYLDLKIGKYSERCLKAVEKLCENLKIKLYVYGIKKEMGKSMVEIFKQNPNKKISNCTICGVIKKRVLNKEAKRLKANKIATGHNLDDEIQTFLMNLFKGSPNLSANSGPITKNIPDKKFIPRIKPLFFIFDKDIKEYAKKRKLPFVYGRCPYRENSYRIQIKKFVNTLSKKDKENIMKNFEAISRIIQKHTNTKIRYCEICGEPSRNKICKKCELIKNINALKYNNV